jgi:hypothetical protein
MSKVRSKGGETKQKNGDRPETTSVEFLMGARFASICSLDVASSKIGRGVGIQAPAWFEA